MSIFYINIVKMQKTANFTSFYAVTLNILSIYKDRWSELSFFAYF